jgi:hypothetical protein
VITVTVADEEGRTAVLQVRRSVRACVCVCAAGGGSVGDSLVGVEGRTGAVTMALQGGTVGRWRLSLPTHTHPNTYKPKPSIRSITQGGRRRHGGHPQGADRSGDGRARDPAGEGREGHAVSSNWSRGKIDAAIAPSFAPSLPLLTYPPPPTTTTTNQPQTPRPSSKTASPSVPMTPRSRRPAWATTTSSSSCAG